MTAEMWCVERLKEKLEEPPVVVVVCTGTFNDFLNDYLLPREEK